MKKLTMLLIFILIGLNLSSCDPEESFFLHYYQIYLKNNTDEEIKLIYHKLGIRDTIVINTRNKITSKYFEHYSYSSDLNENIDFNLIIKKGVNECFNNRIGELELYIGDKFIKTWKGVAAEHLGPQLNSPYNLDSWDLLKYDKVLRLRYDEFIYGEIVFTITDEDIIRQEE